MRRKDYPEAIRRFQARDRSRRARRAGVPESRRRPRCRRATSARPRAIWETLVQVAPDRAYLAFDRLEALADPHRQSPERFTRLCRRLIDENPQDWRARLALSRHLAASGRPHEALDLLFAALVQNPHALSIHQAIWRALGAARPPAGARRPLRRADRARGLLSRSARLHALPLPQHRAALAVPALPRLEHVRRGADRARAGRGANSTPVSIRRVGESGGKGCEARRSLALLERRSRRSVPSVRIT